MGRGQQPGENINPQTRTTRAELRNSIHKGTAADGAFSKTTPSTGQVVFNELAQAPLDAHTKTILRNKLASVETTSLVLAGSRAYGTHRPDSDLDIRGFFQLPTDMFIGIGKPKTEIAYEDEKLDFKVFELGRYFQLAREANPNILEQLYSPELASSPAGEIIRAKRDMFLSQHIANTYGGYAMGQFLNFKKGTGGSRGAAHMRREKFVIHLFRIIEQGEQLLRDGTLDIRVKDPERIKRMGEWPMETIEREFAAADQRRQQLLEKTDLPESPDFAGIDELLVQLRLQYLAESGINMQTGKKLYQRRA